MKLFQITEGDLAALEHVLPQLASDLMPLMSKESQCAGRLGTQLRRVQDILKNVRWNYGPWSNVEKIDAIEPPDTGG